MSVENHNKAKLSLIDDDTTLSRYIEGSKRLDAYVTLLCPWINVPYHCNPNKRLTAALIVHYHLWIITNELWTPFVSAWNVKLWCMVVYLSVLVVPFWLRLVIFDIFFCAFNSTCHFRERKTSSLVLILKSLIYVDSWSDFR